MLLKGACLLMNKKNIFLAGAIALSTVALSLCVIYGAGKTIVSPQAADDTTRTFTITYKDFEGFSGNTIQLNGTSWSVNKVSASNGKIAFAANGYLDSGDSTYGYLSITIKGASTAIEIDAYPDSGSPKTYTLAAGDSTTSIDSSYRSLMRVGTSNGAAVTVDSISYTYSCVAI
jgi:hypothetical protein